MPRIVNDLATDEEHMEVDLPAVTDVQADDKSQIVAPAGSAIDSDAPDVEDIEMDQHIVITPTKATGKAPVLACSPSVIKKVAIVVNCKKPINS